MSEASAILDSATVETPPETPTPEAVLDTKPDDTKVSSKLEMLIKRENEARKLEAAARDKEKLLVEREARLEAFEKSKEDPRKALELLGLSKEELAKVMLAEEGELPPELKIKKIEEKFNKYVESQKADEQRRAEDAKRQAEAQEQKMVADFKGQINSYLKEHNERYEFIAFENQEELVFDVIDEHYKRTIDETTGIGKVMTIADACDKVEQHLEQKYQKAKELKKVSSLWAAVPKGVAEAAKAETRKDFKPPKTLTNNLSSTPAKPPTKPITDEDRVKRAIEFARGLRP